MDASNNTTQPQDSQTTVPKDNSPPPAYTPRRVPDLTALTARAIQARQGLASMIHNIQSQQQQAPMLPFTLVLWPMIKMRLPKIAHPFACGSTLQSTYHAATTLCA
ncbi:hypothetical protein NW754_013055 [Fusarium falciforme]|nr:hypothetical protein NW754_013055 [Fusarium falciforme]